MRKSSTFLVAVCLVAGLTACSSGYSAEPQGVDNCSSLINDPYFSFLPSANKDENPRGYFDEAVAAQEEFLGKINSLIPNDEEEKQLLGSVFDANKALLDIYVGEQMKRTAGQTSLQFQQSMSEEEFNAWIEIGKQAKVVTTQAMDAMQAYADYCNAS